MKLVLATAAIIAATIAGKQTEIYPECGHVVFVNEGGDVDDAIVVKVNDRFYPALADGLDVDDFVAVIMDTNGTEDVSDDFVRSIKYIGRP